jgi:hypothetical protein
LSGGSRPRPQVKGNSETQKILLGNISAIPFQELYEALARQSPDEISRLAKQLETSSSDPQTQAKIKAFFTAWVHLDAKSAFNAAVGFQRPENRTAAVEATVNGADTDALEEIARALAQLPPDTLPRPNRDNFLALAIGKWSESDPAAAARLLERSNIQGFQKSSASHSIALNWARQDPAAALRWAQEQPATPFGLNPLNGAVMGWWSKDPEAAEAYALDQAGTPMGRQLVQSIAGQMANKDRDAAAAWIAKIRDEKLRDQTYGATAAQLAITDPKAASEWGLTLPEGAQTGAISATVSIWAQNSPSEAARWINGLTGKVRDAAVGSYAYAVAETDPAAAMVWAATISDQSQRQSTTRYSMRQWLARDPNAARSWVQNSSLGAEEKAKLLATPTPSP